MAITTSDLFETTTCGRCTGSGHYSFNMLHGTTCYGCGGRGWKLTKRGQAARDAWVAGYTRTVKAQDITPGMKVMVDDAMRGRWVCRTVIKSEADTLNPGQNRWMLTFDASRGGLGGWGTFVDTEIRLPASAADKRAAYEAIAHMPGALGWPVTAG